MFRCSRRQWLLEAGAALAVAGTGCGATRPSSRPTSRPAPGLSELQLSVDGSFANHALRARAGSDRDRQTLLGHPALKALLARRRATGQRVDAKTLLSRMLATPCEPAAVRKALDQWLARPRELAATASAALAYLPAGEPLSATLHLVLGGGIGIAAPPAVLLNLAYPRFLRHPEELALQACHELHHLGFLRLRPLPSTRKLQRRGPLLALIAHATQLEGMAVHAVYPLRRARKRLDRDPDYRVYGDAAHRRALLSRYRALLAKVEALPLHGELPGSEVGKLLGAMSGGDRLWYRVGAWVAHRLEQTEGRPALLASVGQPKRWQQALRAALDERS